MAALAREQDWAPAPQLKQAPAPELKQAPEPELELKQAPAPELKQAPAPELKQAPAPELKQPPAPELKQAPAPELKQPPAPELKQAPAPELKQPPAPELKQAPAPELKQPPAPELKQPPAPELKQAPAPELKQPPARELKQPPAVVRLQGGGGGDMGVVTLVRLRDRMKDQLTEYNTAILGSQENFPDDVIEEKCIQSATQDLQKDIEEVQVSFWNKTLALQRMQITDALRNKVSQDDEESRLILETMKHIVLLSRTIIEYQQEVHRKEQQLINMKRKRLSLKKDGEQKLQQIQTMMKRQREKEASVNVAETQKLLDKLETERQMTTVIQNMFQAIIIGSRVNWAEVPSLKAIVLHLEKNVS